MDFIFYVIKKKSSIYSVYASTYNNLILSSLIAAIPKKYVRIPCDAL